MKLVKMSLVAALLVGSSAFAIDNTKVSGDAQLFYHTSDAASGYDTIKGNTEGSLFSKHSSAADVAFHLNVTTDLSDVFTAGLGYTVISTLGLENNLVSNVWGSSHTATAPTNATYAGAINGAKVEDASWMNEAWVATTVGNTTAKLGRMALDTPLAFTETWSVEQNTFEALVAINTDLPDTTIVAAFVGNGNGTEAFGQNADNNNSLSSNTADLGLTVGGVVNADGDFGTYGSDGAYTVGLINNSYAPLTAQLWYYNVSKVATAHWLQADLDLDGIKFGIQQTALTVIDGKADTALAVMVGYEIKDTLHAKLAYSTTNDDGSLGSVGFNTATSSGASKLYTEAWWSYGYVTAADTTAITLDVEYEAHGIGDFGFFFTTADNGHDNSHDMQEITLTASKTYGALDTTVAVINEEVGSADAVNMVQVYLTYNY